MPIKERIQDAMKDAMRSRDNVRLDCLRMLKGALLNQEKSGGGPVDDAAAIATLRGEIRKRQQTLDILRAHDKREEIAAVEQEIAVIEEFLPTQLPEEEVEARVRAYLAEHPEITQPGPLTGAMKKELGDQVDGRLLNQVCQRVLQG